MSDFLNTANYFPSTVITVEKPEFLDSVSKISEEYLQIIKKENPVQDDLFPVYMTNNYFNKPEIVDFISYVGETSWVMLDNQGFSMKDKSTYFLEMWTQEHGRNSQMEQHTHTGPSAIVGFYFLECPENCSKLLFHDPRVGKVQMGLPENDNRIASVASCTINYIPEPGLMVFSNSWLPHSFTRHNNDAPIKFVHFNLGIRNADPKENGPEII
jgi:hypothetical protein